MLFFTFLFLISSCLVYASPDYGSDYALPGNYLDYRSKTSGSKCNVSFKSPLKKVVLDSTVYRCDQKFEIYFEDGNISFCKTAIANECTKGAKYAEAKVCKMDFGRKKISALEFTNTIAGDSLSEELFFDLALNGSFIFHRGEETVPFVYYAKYNLLCIDGGQSGEMIFLKKDFWLFLRRTEFVWM